MTNTTYDFWGIGYSLFNGEIVEDDVLQLPILMAKRGNSLWQAEFSIVGGKVSTFCLALHNKYLSTTIIFFMQVYLPAIMIRD